MSGSFQPWPYPIHSGGIVSGMIASGSVGTYQTMPYKPPIDPQFMFLFELMVRPEELGMVKALQQDPNNQIARAQYVDYLIDNGRYQSAELVRDGCTPGCNNYKGQPLKTPSEG